MRNRVLAARVGNHREAILKFVLALALVGAALMLPRIASAQNDAIRVMAERVIRGQTGVDDRVYDRGANVDDGWGWIFGRNNGRDRDRLTRERQKLEKHCRKNPNDRRCDDLYYAYGQQRRGAWCLDRNRDGRCDVDRRRDDRRRDDRGRRGRWDDRGDRDDWDDDR